jgi:glutathione synthase/RimK-type ligase-like ATP-grasp enzyme
MSVLILTDDWDPSADEMVLALADRGVEVHRLNTELFPVQLSMSARLHGDRWSGHLRTKHRTVELEDIQAVWYRSPRAYRFPPELSTAVRAHANMEAKYGLGGVLMSLPVLWVNHPSRLADAAYKPLQWVNHPSRLADAAYKPLQLAIAARCGLRVADTLITNEPDAVRGFASEGCTVTKLLGSSSITENGVQKGTHTRLVDDADLADLRGIELTTHLVQRWAPKAHEARMFVIGEHITTAAIHAHNAAAYIDWRTGYGTNTYTLIEPPPEVGAGVQRLMTEMGLLYGALDFVIGPDGEWTFLEINAAGQYGWIEHHTRAPLTEQLADLLAKGPQ